MGNGDTDIEIRTKDFRVVAGGDIKKRPHRHTRREDDQPLTRSEIDEKRSERLRKREQRRDVQAAVEEALDGKTPLPEEPKTDINPDWQAARVHESDPEPRPQGELKAPADRPLTKAQKKELQQAKAERLFGRDKRGVKL